MNLAFQSVIAVIILQAGMIIFPGSDWFLLLRHASQKGVRNATTVAIGLGLGSLLVTLLAIGGLNTLFVAYPAIITVIRYLGVVWLVYQVVITLFPHRVVRVGATEKRLSNPLLSGFINHALNVEMILFYIAVISQLGANGANYTLQVATAFEMALFTGVWFAFIAQASQRVNVIERILALPAARVIISMLFLASAVSLFLAK